MRLTFIGQAPSRETDGKPPFTGRCGAFLATLLGTTQEKMLTDHDFFNVLNYWPGKGIGGDKFPVSEAIKAANQMTPKLVGRTVVLLGSNVARAFGVKNFQYFEWYQIRDPEHTSRVLVHSITIVPHPSGVNRYYNKLENREQASKFLRSLAAQNT